VFHASFIADTLLHSLFDLPFLWRFEIGDVTDHPIYAFFRNERTTLKIQKLHTCENLDAADVFAKEVHTIAHNLSFDVRFILETARKSLLTVHSSEFSREFFNNESLL
jgi:hypothetical protein